MTNLNYKSLYTRFLNGHEGKLHFAAHSHHFWPDVSRDGHMAYWDDCALQSDEKWNKIFGEVIPAAQKTIADILNLKSPGQIVFAPNTHELLTRILSLFVGKNKLSILTTSSEFHSWRRQILRLQEDGLKVESVSTENFLQDKQSFLSELKSKLKNSPDLFFLSQVFFDSGLALTNEDLLDLYQAKSPNTMMVVDGYHAFAALPVDLSQLEGKIFYLGGGYKYAQAGEGVGFMVVPKGDWRPAYTGWFADMGNLALPPGKQVGYPNDGFAFMGATQDMSGLYRFNAVWKLFQEQKMDIKSIHHYVKNLQTKFIELLPKSFLTDCNLKALHPASLEWHGHFLTFEAQDADAAINVQAMLTKKHVLIDRRGQRLRFGFGLYQDMSDIQQVIDRLKS